MTQVLDTSESQLPEPQNGNGQIQRAAQVRQPIIVEDDGAFSNFLDTGRFNQLYRVATVFSCSALVPLHFQGKVNEANCFIACQMAMRLGVDPLMLMQNTYIVHGKPGMEAKLAIALINSSGLFKDSLDYEISGEDPRKPNYKVRAFAIRKTTDKRVDGPWVDWETVRAEGWESKAGSKWKTMPSLMFQYRAATFFGRLHCPERLMGMQTVDELNDVGDVGAGQPETVNVRRARKIDPLNDKLNDPSPKADGDTARTGEAQNAALVATAKADDAPPPSGKAEQADRNIQSLELCESLGGSADDYVKARDKFLLAIRKKGKLKEVTAGEWDDLQSGISSKAGNWVFLDK